jgi:hypothetical protein
MAETDSVPQETPSAPAAPKSPEPPAPPEPPEPQGFPWIRVLAGAMLAAVLVAAVVWIRRPDELELAVRLEPLAPRAGERARLFLKVGPGPALAGATLRKVRAEVLPPADLVFDRNADYLLPGEQEIIFDFAVDQHATLGSRRLVVLLSAELPAGGGRSVAQTVGLHRKVDVWVAAGGGAGR